MHKGLNGRAQCQSLEGKADHGWMGEAQDSRRVWS